MVRVGSAAAVAADLRYPVLGPLAALAPVTAVLFGERLHHDFPTAGRAWVLVAATAPFALGFRVITFITASSGRYAVRIIADERVPAGQRGIPVGGLLPGTGEAAAVEAEA